MSKKTVTVNSKKTLKAQKELYEMRLPTRTKAANPFLKGADQHLPKGKQKGMLTGALTDVNTRGKDQVIKKQGTSK